MNVSSSSFLPKGRPNIVLHALLAVVSLNSLVFEINGKNHVLDDLDVGAK